MKRKEKGGKKRVHCIDEILNTKFKIMTMIFMQTKLEIRVNIS